MKGTAEIDAAVSFSSKVEKNQSILVGTAQPTRLLNFTIGIMDKEFRIMKGDCFGSAPQ